MPRKAPTTVTEQRVTLGTFERAQVAQMVELARRQQVIDGVTRAIVPTIAGVATVSAVVIGMNAYKSIQKNASPEGIVKGFTSFIFGEEAANAAEADRKRRGVSAFDELISLFLFRRPAR